MLRRTWPALCAVALVAAGCGKPDIRVSAQGGDEGFVPLVVDVEGLSGAGVSLATDADGNPHLSYLALPEETAGEEAPAEDPLAPTLPAVMHAHLMEDLWTRGPVAEEQELAEDDETAIAVDADGIHHVAWTAGGQVLYSTNAEGEFQEEPEVVAEVDAAGLSITADDRGQPLISFVEVLTEPEGPSALVRVATPGGGGWEVETAAEAEPDEPISTGIGWFGGTAMVAYGSGGSTQFALRGGNRWSSEVIDENGGAGVDLVVDVDGVPHVTYFDASGAVRQAEPAADVWETLDVGEGAATSPTSIAVDDAGVAHVAWQTGDGIAYANDAGGQFAGQELPPAATGGARPAVGARVEGIVQVAWHDPEDGELRMALLSDDDPLLAVPSPTGAPGGGTTGTAPCQPEGTELQIAAQNLQFDTDCLAAPVAEPFTIAFDNQDALPHNVAIYEEEGGAALFTGETFTGPAAETYEPEPIEQEGNLYFQCDVHPTMNGTFVVAGSPGGGGGGGGGGGS